MKKWSVRNCALGVCLGALAGCAGTASQGELPTFPATESATVRDGTYPNIDSLRLVAPGLRKHQVRDLVGAPHFNEGVVGVRAWNYLFNFRSAAGGTIQCQYQLQFDNERLVREVIWSPASCASVLDADSGRSGAITISGTDHATERHLVLVSDTTFGFDSAVLTPHGQRALDGLLAKGGRGSQLQEVAIVGHADRVGSDATNRVLSLQRADAVKAYLLSRGVPASAVRSEGRGSREPVVQCGESSRRALIECLAPNRRVEVTMQGVSGEMAATP